MCFADFPITDREKNTKTSFTITFGVDIASMCYMYMHMYTTV